MMTNSLKVEWTTGIEFCEDGTRICAEDQKEYCRVVKQRLLENFGGFTLHQARGGWRSPTTGQDVEELSIVYTVIVPGCKNVAEADLLVTRLDGIRHFIRGVHAQESVLQVIQDCHATF